MKCLILVGGYGTRLRPLTLSVAKPLVPFCNMAILEHQIAAAVNAGVTHVILAVGYQPKEMMSALAEFEEKYSIKITFSIEDTPLGTAGPIRLASEILLTDPEPFFVFNSDVICDYALKELLAFHKNHGREGTICVTQVEDPSKYGVVLSDESGWIKSFVEKPKEFVGDKINAGLYILNKSVLERIPQGPCMLERETFPQMVVDSDLYSFKLPGYWADIGQPKDYLLGMSLHLASLHRRSPRLPTFPGVKIIPPVLIHDSARLGEGCVIGPDVTIDRGCVLGRGVRVKNSAIFEGVELKDSAIVSGSIVGWKSKVGRWARLEKMCVLGEDVVVDDEVVVNGAFVLPHKSVKESIWDLDRIVM